MKSLNWANSAKTAASAGLALLAIAAMPATSNASILVVGGNASATVEGNSANGGPFGVTTGNTATYEQVYNASAFSSVSGPISISQIAFRPDQTYGTAFSADVFMSIGLSTTLMSADSLSPTFVAPAASFQHYTLSSANTTTGSGTKAFDIIINLPTPMIYNPAQGNLLLSVSMTGITSTSVYPGTYLDAVSTAGDNTSRAYAYPWSSLNMPTDTTGLVTQFTFSAVPEPGTLMTGIFAAAVPLGMGGLRLLRGRARKA